MKIRKRKQEEKIKYEKTKKRAKFTKKDWFCLVFVVILFSIFGFYKLGTTKMANSYWKPDVIGDSIILEVEDQPIDAIYYLVGVGNDPNGNTVNLEEIKFEVESSNDKINWNPVTLINNISMYSWTEIPVSLIGQKYIRIRGYDTAVVMNEIGFKIAGKQKLAKVKYIDGTSYSYTGKELIDEQDMISLEPSYYNSTYFDEIYHVRTAYEQLKHYPIYENTHPVLGKEIIAGGIAIFGMNPLGWRTAGVVFGILMLPILYEFLKQLFKNTLICFAGTFLFAFDFMHFTQSRIATIDTYAVIFTMLIYYFMYRYYQMSFYDSKLKDTYKPLFWCGIFVGIGFASKWNVAYGFVGIAILFFMNIGKRFKEYIWAKKKIEEDCFDDMDLYVYEHFIPNLKQTILRCILYFVVIPLVIYYFSFIFIFDITNIVEYTKNVIDYNINMFKYHSDLVATHPFQTLWYEWPFMVKPIWYAWNESYSNIGAVSSISCFGSPMVWWGGLIAMITTLIFAIKNKDKTAWFIVIGYLSVYLPWIYITRITFIYHYYPAVIFLVLSLSYVGNKIYKSWKYGKHVILLYTMVSFLLFVYFYPILSGSWTTKEYLKKLQWLPTWTFMTDK